MMLGRKRAQNRREAAIAYSLYGAIVTQAREPVFYRDFGVADTVDGRFDLIVLHAFLVFERLKKLGPEGAALAQAVVDLFFMDMDRSLREMGVGDLAVPKRIKTMAESFAGRSTAYHDAVARRDQAAFGGAIARNLFPEAEVVPPAASALAAYGLAFLARSATDDALLGGVVDFPGPPAFLRPVAAE
jgi:cytochrome b pre-mRNA-processing protein 3